MEKLTCRLLPFEIADGPTNMAADEVLLQSAQKGIASLRFYGWSQPTLSLGYFQSENLRHTDPLLASLPFVRRPSGGETLVHHHEVTYALGLPAGPWQIGELWPIRMHCIFAATLADFGVTATLFQTPTNASPSREWDKTSQSSLCFQHFTTGDIIVATCKVVGSAQRRQHGAIMQHGGVLLAQSPHAPALPGIRELAGKMLESQSIVKRLQSTFADQTGARLEEQSWRLDEIAVRDDLRSNKYSTSQWNCKR